jgi:hypothetical protein
MGHPFRRPGFGATRDALATTLTRGDEAMSEDLLHLEFVPEDEEDLAA